MLSPVDREVRLPLLHDFSHKRHLDPIQGPQKSESEVVYAYPDRGSFFDLDPGVSLVEIVPLGDRDPLHLQDFHRAHHGMDGVFVVKVLIEFASAAIIVVGARLE
jgi:hypothetical protein